MLRAFTGMSPRDECPDCLFERADPDKIHPLLQGYARAWVERYQGTGRRGFRQETRDETRRLLERYALAYFPETTRARTLSHARLESTCRTIAIPFDQVPRPALASNMEEGYEGSRQGAS